MKSSPMYLVGLLERDCSLLKSFELFWVEWLGIEVSTFEKYRSQQQKYETDRAWWSCYKTRYEKVKA